MQRQDQNTVDHTHIATMNVKGMTLLINNQNKTQYFKTRNPMLYYFKENNDRIQE